MQDAGKDSSDIRSGFQCRGTTKHRTTGQRLIGLCTNYLRICKYTKNFAHETHIFDRIMKEYTHYNRIKSVLAEKNKTGTWLSEQMGRNMGTVSRWMTNKVQPSVEQLYDIAKHLDVDVKDLLISSKQNERGSL